MDRTNMMGGGFFSRSQEPPQPEAYSPTEPYDPAYAYKDYDWIIVRVDPTSTERLTMGSMMNSVRRKLQLKRLNKGWYFGVIQGHLTGEGSESNIGTPSIFITKAFNHDYSVYVPEVHSPGESYSSIDVGKRNLRPYNHDDRAHRALYNRALENHPAFFKGDHINANRGAKKGLTLPMTDAVKKQLGLMGGGKTRRVRRRRGRTSRRR